MGGAMPAKKGFVSAAAYARAQALLGANLESKVRSVFVVPHWLGSAWMNFGIDANLPTVTSSLW